MAQPKEAPGKKTFRGKHRTKRALNSDFYDASQAAARGTGRNKGAFIRENAAALCE